jgi:hypothetical protein
MPGVPPQRGPAKKKAARTDAVSSAEVLSLYCGAVKDDLTYDQMLKQMMERFGYPNKELAQARVHRLNSYLRSNFDGHELETLRGSPYLPKSSRRLRELFKEAITQIDRKKKK